MYRVEDVVDTFLRDVNGHRYSSDSSVRFGPRFYDCSGSVFHCLTSGAGLATWTVPTISATQAIWLHNHGMLHPDGPGNNPPAGWLRFHGVRPSQMGMDGYGDAGHVAIADGNWGVYEGQGHANGCGHFSARGRNWMGCGPIPGMIYGGTPAPTPGGWLMALNDAQQAELLDNSRLAVAALYNFSKPSGLRDINARLANVESLLGNLSKRGALQTIDQRVERARVDVAAVRAKLGA